MVQILATNIEFETWYDLKKVIIDHGVATERVIVSVKDKKRYMAKCRMHIGEDEQ